MSCCGSKRAQFATQNNPSNRAASFTHPNPRHARSAPPKVVFRYSGRTALAVIGPISGRRYLFAHSGAQVEIDPRDRHSVAAVPNLRQET